MKKFVLILMLGVFAFGTSSFTTLENSKESVILVDSTCFDQADGLATLGGVLFGWSHQEENQFFDAVLDSCYSEYPNGVVPD